MLKRQLFDTSRGRIVELLRRDPQTAEELASKLGLTATAVRAQITAMERDGVVRRRGLRPGATKPSHVFELTTDVEQLLSRAYIPLLTQLIEVSTSRLRPEQLEALIREAGKRLGDQLSPAQRAAGHVSLRVAWASTLLNEELGAVTHVEEKAGRYIIRGAACPLAALTGKHPAVCLAIESLLTEVVGVPVHECCDRTGRPRCCFEFSAAKRK